MAKKTTKKTTKSKTKAGTKRPAKAAASGDKSVRAGSKLEIVVGLLKRPEGCTAADAMAATGWPSLSFNQQAAAAGISLRKEKQGKVTRYWAA